MLRTVFPFCLAHRPLWLTLAIAGLLLTATGCQSSTTASESASTPEAPLAWPRIEQGKVPFPNEKYLVGAGFTCEFATAPSNGTFVCANLTNQTVLSSHWFSKGDAMDDIYLPQFEVSDSDEYLSWVFVDEPNAPRIVYYFIPDPKPANDTFIRFKDGKLLAPVDKHLVAIGSTVEFEAPFGGTMVVFETTTNTSILMTTSSTPPKFNSITSEAVKRFSEKENIPVEDMQFAVYFNSAH